MDKKPLAVIVGSRSLLGREIADILAGSPIRVRPIGADSEEAGLLTEQAGEPMIMTELDAENLAGARVAFLTGSVESGRKTLEIISKLATRPALIDLTYLLEDRATASLRAPVVEPANYAATALPEHVIAHPAAIVLALFLQRVARIRHIREAVAHIFEPASERAKPGIVELEKQTVNLLTLKPPPKKLYDEQVAFNLLARWGGEAPGRLEDIEARIDRHLGSLLSLDPGIATPSVRLIQAPVFHGYSISVRVEFDENPGTATLEKELAAALIDVRGPDLDPPNIVGMAGQSGIAVGAIAADRQNPRAVWFWIAADNLRIMAENAVAVARSLIGQTGIARTQ